jgi:GTP cyclohydrolase IA
MSENKRRKNHTDLECVKEGYANGVAPGFPLTEQEKWEMVDKAELAYGQFLTALGVDWENDPNSSETPSSCSKSLCI